MVYEYVYTVGKNIIFMYTYDDEDDDDDILFEYTSVLILGIFCCATPRKRITPNCFFSEFRILKKGGLKFEADFFTAAGA